MNGLPKAIRRPQPADNAARQGPHSRQLLRRFQRLWGALSFGIIEQILLSGSSFVMTAAMAHTLGPTEFGWFSIGWSIALLFEAKLVSYSLKRQYRKHWVCCLASPGV